MLVKQCQFTSPIHQVGAFFALSGYVAASCSVEQRFFSRSLKWYGRQICPDLRTPRRIQPRRTRSGLQAQSCWTRWMLGRWTFALFKCKSGATNGFVWKWSTPKVHKNQKSVVYHHCGESKILERNQLCVCSGVMVLSFATFIDELFARSYCNHQIFFWKFEETVLLRWTSNPFLLSAMLTASSHIGNLL